MDQSKQITKGLNAQIRGKTAEQQRGIITVDINTGWLPPSANDTHKRRSYKGETAWKRAKKTIGLAAKIARAEAGIHLFDSHRMWSVEIIYGLGPKHRNRDVDNTIKIVLDALQQVIYGSDKQVATVRATKFAAPQSRLIIVCQKLPDTQMKELEVVSDIPAGADRNNENNSGDRRIEPANADLSEKPGQRATDSCVANKTENEALSSEGPLDGSGVVEVEQMSSDRHREIAEA